MNDLIPKSEVEAYRTQLVEADKYANEVVITNENDYVDATIQAKKIKERLDLIVGRKEEITKPLNLALKSVRELFKPLESFGEMALSNLKGKMIAYTNKKEKEGEIAKAKIDARVDKGTLTESTAEVKKFMIDSKLDNKTVYAEGASSTTRKVKKYYVVDKSKIPLQFMEPDMALIRAQFKAGYPVDGVEERIENELAIR